MNVFGLGAGELILVLTLALIVFGPKKLPEIGAGIGKAVGQFRKATNEITQEINREMQVDGLKELASIKDIPRDLRGVATSVYQAAQTPVTKPVTPPETAAQAKVETQMESPSAERQVASEAEQAGGVTGQVPPTALAADAMATSQVTGDVAPQKPRRRSRVRLREAEEATPSTPETTDTGH